MKHIIKNRYGLNVVVEYTAVENPQGLAFVQHGFSGFKEQPHILKMAETFQKHNISTVLFDATHAFGESDGSLEHARLGKHAEDLEDVIAWAKTQDWYIEPFVLAGHSFGGASVLSYASQYSEDVKAIAPLSSVVSGNLIVESLKKYEPEEWEEIQTQGYVIKESSSKAGARGKVVKELYDEMMQHDFLKTAGRLTMPTLLIVGEEDRLAMAAQKALFEKLPEPKEFHFIKGCGHTFRSDDELSALQTHLSNWITNCL